MSDGAGESAKTRPLRPAEAAWGSETLSVSQNWFIKFDPPQTRLRQL
jgi:hypothetical protein